MWYDFLFQPATCLQMLVGQLSILLVIYVSATLVLKRLTLDMAIKLEAIRMTERRRYEDKLHTPLCARDP
jgi:hypothetical protein